MTEKKEILPLTEEEIRQPFERNEKLTEILLFATHNWKVDSDNWNALLWEINDLVKKEDLLKQRLLGAVEKAFGAGIDWMLDCERLNVEKPSKEEYMEQLKKTL